MKRMKEVFDGIRTRFAAFSPESPPADSSTFLSEDDLLSDLREHGATNRLLGRFTEADVRAALAENGVLTELAARGYPEPCMVIRSIDPFRQNLRLMTCDTDPEDDEHILCDLRVFDSWLRADSPLDGRPFEINALVIDWLLFQDPRASFTPEKPRLPGQRFPGLGIMRPCMRAILGMAADIGKEAVVNIPEYFHNAYLYRPEFRFFSPGIEGQFLVLQRFLAPLVLSDASGAVATEQIWDGAANKPFTWKPHEQMLPLAPRIADYFRSREYAQKVGEAEKVHSFHWRTA